uniref:Odorant receptor n=1 Tax=Heliothis virescens TaxID=7102 RepID=A0A2A4JHA7_HELVI
MKCMIWLKQFKRRLEENSFENLIWLLNGLPRLCGFPLFDVKFNYLFWTIHMFLLFYIYIVGIVVYQMYSTGGFIDCINSFFNISAFILVFVDGWWIYKKRTEFNKLLEVVKKNDDLITETGRFLDVHEKMLRSIKIIIIMCYVFHFVNEIMIFIPFRTLKMDDFSIASCVGLEPLDVSPNHEICMGLLAVQVVTSVVLVCSYDLSLLFLFSHTTAVFQILFEEMMSLNEIAETCQKSDEDYDVIVARLRNVTVRHVLALHTVRKLEDIFSISIGICFGLDTISLCLFFVLPLEVCMHFAPMIYHSLFIFFLYCCQGQRLTTASEKFEMAVYCCGWENLRVKERRQVLLMLVQAQRPVIVYAARIIPIRIHTFASTMESIYKFVTIFKV